MRLSIIAAAVGCSILNVSPSFAHSHGAYFVKASYYSYGSLTASGEPFNQNGFTAASKTLPFGTRLLVTNPSNGRSVVVRVNDRGPFVKGRDLDLAKGAAESLGMIKQGTATVKIVHLGAGEASGQS